MKLHLWHGLVLGVLVLFLGQAYFLSWFPDFLLLKRTTVQIEQGKQVFAQNCRSCHGAEAIGENPEQPNGGQELDGKYLAPALNGTGHSWHHSDDVLLRIVTKGSIAEDSPMKGFEERLSSDEIIAVIQYIKSLWPEETLARHSERF